MSTVTRNNNLLHFDDDHSSQIVTTRMRAERVRLAQEEMQRKEQERLQSAAMRELLAQERREQHLLEIRRKLAEKHKLIEAKCHARQSQEPPKRHGGGMDSSMMLHPGSFGRVRGRSAEVSSHHHSMSQSWAPSSSERASLGFRPFPAAAGVGGDKKVGDARPRSSTGRVFGFGSSSPRVICQPRPSLTPLSVPLSLPLKAASRTTSISHSQAPRRSASTVPVITQHNSSSGGGSGGGARKPSNNLMTQSMTLAAPARNRMSQSLYMSPRAPVSLVLDPVPTFKTRKAGRDNAKEKENHNNEKPQKKSALPPVTSPSPRSFEKTNNNGVGGARRLLSPPSRQAPDVVTSTRSASTPRHQSPSSRKPPLHKGGGGRSSTPTDYPIMEENQEEAEREQEELYRQKLAEQRKLAREKRQRELLEAEQALKQQQQQLQQQQLQSNLAARRAAAMMENSQNGNTADRAPLPKKEEASDQKSEATDSGMVSTQPSPPPPPPQQQQHHKLTVTFAAQEEELTRESSSQEQRPSSSTFTFEEEIGGSSVGGGVQVVTTPLSVVAEKERPNHQADAEREERRRKLDAIMSRVKDSQSPIRDMHNSGSPNVTTSVNTNCNAMEHLSPSTETKFRSPLLQSMFTSGKLANVQRRSPLPSGAESPLPMHEPEAPIPHLIDAAPKTPDDSSISLSSRSDETNSNIDPLVEEYASPTNTHADQMLPEEEAEVEEPAENELQHAMDENDSADHSSSAFPDDELGIIEEESESDDEHNS